MRDHAAATVTGKTIGNTHICNKIRINIIITITTKITTTIIITTIIAPTIIMAGNADNTSRP
ncbi:hypothetical protein [Methanoplanus limicola]|uniref:Uncharacterized protein n=1 Tax=Methanoplanus limicola DSM 2279 TaxID=937775 RepID=H1Z487_9EURY|nr:hypothetical protein [Methanoplanus limicola]EHQ36635.1 hypothetical protein Metlim_2593 [Methanoplanus limicola DSM 2279]